MSYPLVLSEVMDGYTMYIPDPLFIKTTYERLCETDPRTPFPFWAQLWPSAYALAAFLTEEPQWVTGKKVLELGAGLGLPSFVAARYAAQVLLSDHIGDAVETAEKNIRHLGLGNTRAAQLNWNDFHADTTTDVLLLSDLNYSSGDFQPLLQLIRHFIRQKTTILITTPHRINITPFAEALQPFLQRSEERTHNNTEIRLLVLSDAVGNLSSSLL